MAVVVKDIAPISIADIQAVYGGSTQALQNYYRGGAFVPNVAGTAPIATAGAIDMFSFLNTYKFTLNIPTTPLTAADPDDVAFGINFDEDGTFFISRTNQSTVFGTWSPDATIPPQLEARLRVVSGSTPKTVSVGFNVWQDCQNLVFGDGIVNSNPDSRNGTVELDLRARGNTNPIVTWSFFWEVETVGGGGVGGGPPL